MVTVINAEGAVIGRLGAIVAKRLLKGEEIAIVNSEKAIITGKKKMIKAEYRQKREVGTYRKGPYFPRMPDAILKRTIRGMMPYQTPHGRAAFKRLKCYINVPDEFKDKEFQIIEKAKKQPADYITVGDLSRFLGAKF
ncbi:MAG: 50S ribosomal protein L13 [Candidatus Thermoplasmatota archaeon]